MLQLHAEYDKENDEYCAHRVSQAFDTAQLIRYTRQGADFCILGGDLNTEPGDLPYRLIRHNTGMEDSFATAGQTAADGMTSETPHNSYTQAKRLEQCPNGARIDYVMYCNRPGLKVETIECFNPLPSRVGGFEFSYSDHEAVCSKLRVVQQISTDDEDENNQSITEELKRDSLNEALQLFDNALKKLSRDGRNYWLLFVGILILLISLPTVGDASGGGGPLRYILAAFRLATTLVDVYCLIMATVWNRIERHGILSGKLAVAIQLESLAVSSSQSGSL